MTSFELFILENDFNGPSKRNKQENFFIFGWRLEGQ
jgi:hypothetical protein